MNHPQKNNDEYNLKDIFNSINSSVSLILKFRFRIIFTSILFSLLFFCFAYFSKPNYNADLRFIVKSDAQNAGFGTGMLGGLNAILGTNMVGSPLEKTVEIAKSDRIIGSTLLAKVPFNGKEEVLANILIEVNDLHSSWRDDTLLRLLKFGNSDTSIEAMSFAKRKALKKLQNIVIPNEGRGIFSKSFDKKSGVVTLSAVHHNEAFAIILLKEIFNKLRNFYVEQTVYSASYNVQVLQQKVDSIKYELSKVQSAYARKTDQSFGLIFQEDKVELRKLSLREQILVNMYAEAQKNLETFKFMNESAIPNLTVIDMPYTPLRSKERSKVLFLILGFVSGALLSIILILLKEWYRNFKVS